MKSRLASIVARLGQDDAETVARIVGGTRLYVPSDPRNAGRLVELFGEAIALKLIFHFADDRFYVPTMRGPVRVDIADVERLVGEGWSSARIARELQCSERIVDRKRAKLRSRALPIPKSGG